MSVIYNLRFDRFNISKIKNWFRISFPKGSNNLKSLTIVLFFWEKHKSQNMNSFLYSHFYTLFLKNL